MSQLTIIQEPLPARSEWKPGGAVAARFGLLLLIAVALRFSAEQRAATESNAAVRNVSVQQIAEFFPTAEAVAEPAESGFQTITDANGHVLGTAAYTSPFADHIIGYSGISNALIVADHQSRVCAVRFVSSQDTPEHVAVIQSNPSFFHQFSGWTVGEPETFTSVDAVSGATLTSLAIAEGIAVRLGSDKPSLRFPVELNEADLDIIFDPSHGLTLRSLNNVESTVVDAAGQPTGTLIRTGPLTDSIIGYQGPTELLLFCDADSGVKRLAVRQSYDNEPYVGYVRDDDYFPEIFTGRTLADLQTFDLQEAQVEGVSGATMTSLAVAETIVAAAAAYSQRRTSARENAQKTHIHWSSHDIGTVVILALAGVIGLTGLRGVGWIRILWNVILVVYFGLITGNLISQAVLLGWAARGMAWRLAPGLAAVVVVSLILPAATKRNLYCSHICAHGAAQQLLRGRWNAGWKLNRRMAFVLSCLPGAILVTIGCGAVAQYNWNLAAWEPFDAYIWYVAGFSSLLLAGGSLVLSAVIPMAYCRFGCPTGRLLEYIRRTARSDSVTIADGCAALLAAAAWIRVLYQIP